MLRSLRQAVTFATGGVAVLVLFFILASQARAEEPQETEPNQSTFAIRLAPWDSSRQIPVHLVGRIDEYYGGGYRPRSRGFGYPFHFGGAFGWVYSYNRRFGPSQRSFRYYSRYRPRTSRSPVFTHPNFDHFDRYGYGSYYPGHSPYTYY